jgi:hypothetical protein
MKTIFTLLILCFSLQLGTIQAAGKPQGVKPPQAPPVKGCDCKDCQEACAKGLTPCDCKTKISPPAVIPQAMPPQAFTVEGDMTTYKLPNGKVHYFKGAGWTQEKMESVIGISKNPFTAYKGATCVNGNCPNAR